MSQSEEDWQSVGNSESEVESERNDSHDEHVDSEGEQLSQSEEDEQEGVEDERLEDEDEDLAEDEGLSLLELVNRNIDDEVCIMKKHYDEKRMYRNRRNMQEWREERQAKILQAEESIRVCTMKTYINIYPYARHSVFCSKMF